MGHRLPGDDEAYAIWRDEIGVPAERIQRRGMADNYWSMGVPGPCGPCSEIYYDRGPEYGREGGPAADEDRYLEIWNLVFMQYERSKVRAKDDFEIVGLLPAKNIDTGMGLERMASILQGVDNLYEIDTTRTILDRAAELTGRATAGTTATDVALRVIADHVRTALMLIGDGVIPGNEGRGYVLRRIMRRSIRNLRAAGRRAARRRRDPGDGRALHARAHLGRDRGDGPAVPGAGRDAANIHTVIDAEEAAFPARCAPAPRSSTPRSRRTGAADSATLAGAQAFQLHDTYGFPIDLTLEMAAEQGLTVDEEGFRRLMAEQRDRAKADAQAKKTGHADVSAFARAARAVRRGHLHRLRPDLRRGDRPRPAGRRRPGALARARAPRSSWSSTAPRSTPRAAASSPTRA